MSHCSAAYLDDDDDLPSLCHSDDSDTEDQDASDTGGHLAARKHRAFSGRQARLAALTKTLLGGARPASDVPPANNPSKSSAKAPVPAKHPSDMGISEAVSDSETKEPVRGVPKAQPSMPPALLPHPEASRTSLQLPLLPPLPPGTAERALVLQCEADCHSRMWAKRLDDRVLQLNALGKHALTEDQKQPAAKRARSVSAMTETHEQKTCPVSLVSHDGKQTTAKAAESNQIRYGPDSWLVRGYKDAAQAAALQQALMQEYNWLYPGDPRQARTRARTELARVKACCIARNTDGTWPYYGRYTGARPLHKYAARKLDAKHSPVTQQLVEELVTLMPRGGGRGHARFNHVIGTIYRDQDDHIPPHSDKLLDIAPDTDIVSLSFGAGRDLVFTVRQECRGDDRGLKNFVVKLNHGDLFVMGPQTNAQYKHGVPQVARPVGERVSLIFRAVDGRRKGHKVTCGCCDR